jgi:hypothetical protein
MNRILISLLLLGLATCIGSTVAQPAKIVTRLEEDFVTVVAEPKYYVSGAIYGEDMQLFKEPDQKQMGKVDGFVFEVIRPTEYAGRIFGMHHDGLLASGDPYKLWEIGRRYEFGIPRQNIGKLSFGLCSVHGTRMLLPKAVK